MTENFSKIMLDSKPGMSEYIKQYKCQTTTPRNIFKF